MIGGDRDRFRSSPIFFPGQPFSPEACTVTAIAAATDYAVSRVEDIAILEPTPRPSTPMPPGCCACRAPSDPLSPLSSRLSSSAMALEATPAPAAQSV